MKLSTPLLAVKDLNASIAFYEALGFQRKQGGGAIAFLSDGERTLALAKGEILTNVTGKPAAPGTSVALVFLARQKPEVDAAMAAAKKAGATVLHEPQDGAWGGYSAAFADPDGNIWVAVHNDGLYRG